MAGGSNIEVMVVLAWFIGWERVLCSKADADKWGYRHHDVTKKPAVCDAASAVVTRLGDFLCLFNGYAPLFEISRGKYP